MKLYKVIIVTFAVIGFIFVAITAANTISKGINNYIDNRIDKKIGLEERDSNIQCHIETGYNNNNTVVYSNRACGYNYVVYPPVVNAKVAYVCIILYNPNGTSAPISLGPPRCPIIF